MLKSVGCYGVTFGLVVTANCLVPKLCKNKTWYLLYVPEKLPRFASVQRRGVAESSFLEIKELLKV